MSDDSSFAPAGWYPDPADDARLRRWDGSGWTQDVVLAPDKSPVGFVPPPPPPAPSPASPPAPAPPPAPREQAQPASGPVTLPEWATLPGLTLPPDLSMIPGMTPDSVLSVPTFVEPAPVFAEQPRILPRPDWNQSATLQPPVFTAPTDAPTDAPTGAPTQPAGPPRPPTADATRPTAPNFPPPPPPRRGPAPAEHYAPPPGGSQYDAPPPPGASSAPGASIALPASSLVAPRMPSAAWAAGPVIDRTSRPPVDFSELPRTSAVDPPLPAGGILTLWVWLIAILPLLQFVIVYLVFIQLGVAFSPGIQWGILAAPALFSLLFASGDRRKLTSLGIDRVPSPLLAIVPPVYLLVRSFDVGRSSVGALVAWILLQAGAIAGVVYLMPHVLAQAIAAS